MRGRRSGFSIVELMVVVAIISVLAALAIPQFQKMKTRAIRAGAKSELTGLYTAEKAFYAEYGTYHTNLPYIGFVPEGIRLGSDGCPVGPTTAASVAPGVIRVYRVGFMWGGDGSANYAVPVNGQTIRCVYPQVGDLSSYYNFYPLTPNYTLNGVRSLVGALPTLQGPSSGYSANTDHFIATADGILAYRGGYGNAVDVVWIDDNRALTIAPAGSAY